MVPKRLPSSKECCSSKGARPCVSESALGEKSAPTRKSVQIPQGTENRRDQSQTLGALGRVEVPMDWARDNTSMSSAEARERP